MKMPLALKTLYIHLWLNIAYEDVGLTSLVSLSTKFHIIDGTKFHIIDAQFRKPAWEVAKLVLYYATSNLRMTDLISSSLSFLTHMYIGI